MALGDVLEVLSEAIRGDASPDALAAMIAGRAGLTETERGGLARIPYARLAPYQHDIYQAERNMLVWGFTNTWSCLRAMGFASDEDDDDAERAFVIAFKRDCPCETHSVREMGVRFLAFLAERHAPLCTARPWLLELAEVERLEIEVLYAMDHPHGKPLDAAAREEFFAQSVGALMMAQVVRAEQVHILRLEHDIPAIKSAISEGAGDGAPLDLDAPAFQRLEAPMYLGIARDHDTLEPAWYYADAVDAACVGAVTEGTAVSIEEHAEATVHRITPADAPAEQQLARYLAWLERAFRLRYLLLA